ncbi:DNA-directed RNA polymerase I [Cryptosporidium ryanae]|uniref:DNA-directed RNA polymerase I n=1 Tax=Cryptosporidium ryanae TaxID=515981 RepID=UPI00351A9E2A|nr:DNA-directed RNA polymerase I [Cryptosporidium ryanae]
MNLAPICSDIYSATFELLKASDVKKLSVCHVTSTITFESTGESKVGGLHDLRMGPLSNRDFCGTCGGRNDCPGHVGHIELELPAFHPLFLGKLVRLLKCCCWHCCRIRMPKGACLNYIKRFEDVTGELDRDYSGGSDVLSSNSYSLEKWEEIKREFLDKASKCTKCSSCGNSFKGQVKESQLGIGITLSWPEGSKPPISLSSTWSESFLTGDSIEEENEGSGSKANNGDGSETSSNSAKTPAERRDFEDDFVESIPQEAKIYTKQGKGTIVQHFQAFQIVPIVRNVWNNNNKLLEYLFPVCKKLSWEAFFLFVMPVSANKFRPMGISSGRNMPLLHPRTSGLLSILTANERLKFYIDLQRREGEDDLDVNSELFSNLVSYSSSLQEKVNSYLDQTKSFKPSSATPGIRQWLEKKAGIIRQKMMGKRVNYSARTVIGPDPYLETNEIGVPLMFALNLTIPERINKHNVALASKLVENGSSMYPGANKLLLGGVLYDLSRLDANQRKAKARLLLSSVLSASNPFQSNSHPIVYRHLFDGDIVLMNRQPTLHRPSIMAHRIRIQPKDNIMRLNYVNCGTYNADFDGDEMNLHLPQSLFSRSEAKYIMDASRQYSVPKSGEPLRGLIQDSCVGSTFLTGKSTFLSKEEYFHLIYTSLSFILDRKHSAISTSPMFYSSAGQVVFGSKNRYSEVNSPLGKIKIDESVLRDHIDSGSENKCSDGVRSGFQVELNPRNLDTNCFENNIILESPTILKPVPFWTGKQVFTSLLKTLLYNLVSKDPKVYSGINLVSKSRTPGDSWNGKEDGETEEAIVVIRNSELLQGVIDKNQIGSNPYCLVHLCTELVGPLFSGKLLSALFNLSQVFLQMRGFTCSISDMLLTPKAERERIKLIRRYSQASAYIQEVFQHHVFKETGFESELRNESYFDDAFSSSALHSQGCGVWKKKNLFSKLRELKRIRYEEKNNTKNDDGSYFVNDIVDFSEDSGESTLIVLDLLIRELKKMSQENNKEENKRLLLDLVKTMRECRVGPRSIFKSEHSDGISDLMAESGSKKQECRSEDTILYDTTWLSQGKMEQTTSNLLGDQGESDKKTANGSSIGDFFIYPNELTRRKLESLIGNKLSASRDSLLKIMDAISKIGLGDITSRLGNLLKGSSSKFPFPHNGFSSMVLTGAKGSRVNHNMICVMLGQQELEGRRVPIMPSMKTLPSFASYDFGSRAGGLITDRYLDGLHAQEFFFHCMSGREGLVDTAVKTARSGYLQRCILKGLESMIVHYDGTVRSEDDAIVQFTYGDDGIDVSKSSYLTRLDDLVRNRSLLCRDVKFEEAFKNKYIVDSFKSVLRFENEQSIFRTYLNQDKSAFLSGFNKRARLNKPVSDGNSEGRGLEAGPFLSEKPPNNLRDQVVNSVFPSILNGGSVSESFLSSLSESNMQKLIRLCGTESTGPIISSRNNKRSLLSIQVLEESEYYEKALELERLLRLKYMKTQVSPGEAVGCLAAQSIGEPATQMTLNTFHLAGHGAANVTLGIPRLRELLQTGGDSKTPYIFVPLLEKKHNHGQDREGGADTTGISLFSDKVLDCFKSIPLSDIIENVGVESSIVYENGNDIGDSEKGEQVSGSYCWKYEVSIQFLDLDTFCQIMPQYNASDLINLTLSKCIKPFLRQVSSKGECSVEVVRF